MSRNKRIHDSQLHPSAPSILNRSLQTCLMICAVLLGGNWKTQVHAQQEANVDRYRTDESIPLSLSGFTANTLQILRFDLEIQGFKITPRGEAEFELSGSGGTELRGQLRDLRSGRSVMHRAYGNGENRRQVHSLADDVVQAVFQTPGIANTLIAFRGKSGRNWEVYVSDFDGHNARAVTQDASTVAAPTWMPGKMMLYYTTYKIGGPNIVSHDLQTGNRQRITRNTGLNTSAAIAPNGNKMAMILSKSGSPDLYVAQKDGSGEIRLTRSKEEEACPCWSPDGNTICFTSGARGGARLFTIPAEGGSIKRLSTGAIGGMITEPDWSPDGRWIAFTSVTGGRGTICVMEASGGNATAFVSGEDPSWAPNSRTLVFMREKNGQKTLSLLDVPTKEVKDIRQFAGEQSQPSWAR